MHDAVRADDIHGVPEMVSMAERLVVAPRTGRFVPLPPETFTTEGEWDFEGQALAEIQNGSDSAPVISLFSGWVMGMLAIPGQPVEVGSPLFRVRP